MILFLVKGVYFEFVFIKDVLNVLIRSVMIKMLIVSLVLSFYVLNLFIVGKSNKVFVKVMGYFRSELKMRGVIIVVSFFLIILLSDISR